MLDAKGILRIGEWREPTPGCPICVYPGRAGIVYNKCSLEELQAFIKARNIPHSAAGHQLKYCLIRILEHADHKATFRFLDLAPELRNRVYSELLVIKEDDWYCYPQIIATSREIHREAKTLLETWESHEIIYTLWLHDLDAVRDSFAVVELKSGGEVLEFSDRLDDNWCKEYDCLKVCEPHWPESFSHVRSVRIELLISRGGEAFAEVKNIEYRKQGDLYNLAACLQQSAMLNESISTAIAALRPTM